MRGLLDNWHPDGDGDMPIVTRFQFYLVSPGPSSKGLDPTDDTERGSASE